MRSSFLYLLLPLALQAEDYPWTYDNDVMGGPNFWGLMLGKESEMCAKGKLQSPIDIRPDRLLFDPNAKPIHIDRNSVMSELVNTGQMARIRIGNSFRFPSVNLTGGPIQYRYRIQRIDIHFGRQNQNGSEHTIDGRRFPMELQLLAFNTDLYSNFSIASKSPRGLVAVSILVDFGVETNDELLKLTIASASVLFKGKVAHKCKTLYAEKRVELADLRPWKLLPPTRDYITYEGSLTSPGCHETVTWIIVNQPIHISIDHWNEWGKLQQTLDVPKKGDEPRFVGPNVRAAQELHARLLRTNIHHKVKVQSKQECRNAMPRIEYRVNSHLRLNSSHHSHKKRRHFSEYEWDFAD